MIALLVAAQLFAQAIPPEQCRPLDDIVAVANERGGTVRPLRGDALAKAVDIYNRTPPASTTVFDLGVVIEAPNGAAIIFLGNGSSLCTFFAANREQWQRLRAQLFGMPT